mgnify:CR=1 FL=1
MELEFELKAPAPLSKVEAKLRELGASLKAVEREVDIYFQHPCRDFASMDEALRLRRRGGVFLLTYKGPKLEGGGRCKARPEVEVSVSSFEGVLELLSSLGFKEVAEIRKERSMYELPGFRVYLDRVEGLGEFVEVECVTDSSKLREVESSVLKLAEELGVDVSRATIKSYLELYLEGARRGQGGLREASSR